MLLVQVIAGLLRLAETHAPHPVEFDNDRLIVVIESAVNIRLLTLPEKAPEVADRAALGERVKREKVIPVLRELVTVVRLALVRHQAVSDQRPEMVVACATNPRDRLDKLGRHKLMIPLANLNRREEAPLFILEVLEH